MASTVSAAAVCEIIALSILVLVGRGTSECEGDNCPAPTINCGKNCTVCLEGRCDAIASYSHSPQCLNTLEEGGKLSNTS